MAEIINLNKARKKRKKERSAEKAAENRVRFGRTAAQKKLDQSLREKAQKELDAAQRNLPTEKSEDEGPADQG